MTCPASLIYDGSARTPCTVAVTGAGGLSLTPAASYSHNTDAGTATASYTYAGDANHDGSSDSKDFTINKRNVTASISAADKTYDSTNAATIASCSLETQSSDHGVVSPDAVGCAGSNAHFGNQDAANGKLVTAEVSLTGAAQGNYQLTSPTASTTANISMRDVTRLSSASPGRCTTVLTGRSSPLARWTHRAATMGQLRVTPWVARVRTVTSTTRTQPTASRSPVMSP